MVMKNEADRYLESCIESIWTWAHDVHIYDDRSTDDSVEVATKLGCTVTVRQEHEPSFLEHEGQFRYNAWRALQNNQNPRNPDWCLSIDADEFLVAEDGQTAEAVDASIEMARHSLCAGVILPIPEVFHADVDAEGNLVKPQVRTDGFWGTIKGPRLFEWRRGGIFSSKAMGSGSEPTYVAISRLSPYAQGLSLLHLGYCHPEDRKAKAERYNNLIHGHADAHIQSILQTPTLKPWQGTWSPVRRGGSGGSSND